MSLIGLQQRNSLCKICNAFSDELLNEITLDIILSRRTWVEIRKHYSKLLPTGVTKLNDVNINSHRKHCDPKLLVEKYLKEHGEPVTPGEALMYVFSTEFQKELDRKKLLVELYKTRLKNLETLQVMLDKKTNEFKLLTANESPEEIEKRNLLIKDIRSLSQQIDNMMDGLQDVVVREINSNKDFVHQQNTININYINNVQVGIQNFLQELVPYIMMEYKDNQEAGKNLLKYISSTMDRYLAPMLDETKLLQQSNKK